MKTYLTYQDDKSHKFWQIETAENSFTLIYGKVGTNGQSKTKTFADSQTAEKEAEKLIEQKKKKGYAEKGASITINSTPKQKETNTLDLKKRKQSIKKCFNRKSIIGATIQSKTRMGFITHAWGKSHEGPDEREIFLILYDATVLGFKSGISAMCFEGIVRGNPVLSQDGKNSVLGLFAQGNRKGAVDEFLDHMKNYETISTKINSQHYSMWGTATIDGEIYFAGTPRTLYKRTAPGKWKNLTDRKKHPQMFIDAEKAEAKSDEDGFVNIEIGFHAVDGFAKDDIYAGGEKGDCWHYDGTNWRQLQLPTKTDINSICCAADGFVYIGGSQGTLLKGRLETTGEHWEQIPFSESPSNEIFTSLTWFQDQLWIGGWYGAYRLEMEKNQLIVKPYVSSKSFSVSGNVCSCKEALMVWNDSQVLLYDGEHLSLIHI